MSAKRRWARRAASIASKKIVELIELGLLEKQGGGKTIENGVPSPQILHDYQSGGSLITEDVGL